MGPISESYSWVTTCLLAIGDVLQEFGCGRMAQLRYVPRAYSNRAV
jgi:hypothetical protein